MLTKIVSFPHLRCKTGLRAKLLLENGYGFEGCGFGYPATRVGEVVFSTSMTGYPEGLTDPSYKGQILVYTHPMVGNYGVPRFDVGVHGIPLHYESDRVQVEGFIVAELPQHHHAASVMGLSEWLVKSKVPGMYRVDTRMIVKLLREKGVMMGVLSVYPEKEEIEWDELVFQLERSPRYDEVDYTSMVSPTKPMTHEPPNAWAHVSLLDCGVKYGILRRLLLLGIAVTRYPCSTKPEKLLDGYDGVVLSNGPGNPAILGKQAKTAAAVAETGKPVLAICLGMQLLAIGMGGKTYKLPYGHRGPNKPVVETSTGRCFITTQNHGYAVDPASMEDTGLKIWFVNPDDKSVEGLVHTKLPVIATQFHPEAGPGPHDTFWVFERYAKMVKRNW